jgi:hypothetical protein
LERVGDGGVVVRVSTQAGVGMTTTTRYYTVENVLLATGGRLTMLDDVSGASSHAITSD